MNKLICQLEHFPPIFLPFFPYYLFLPIECLLMPDTMVGASSQETWLLLLRHSFCLGRCHLTSAVIVVIGGPVGGAFGPTWRSQERPHLDGDSWVGLPCVLSQSAAIHSCREQKNQCLSSSRKHDLFFIHEEMFKFV